MDSRHDEARIRSGETMTDLEREAREAMESQCRFGSPHIKLGFFQGYLAAAEPREKRIKLLEKIIEDMEEDSYDPFPIKGD